ncbi:VOC family protein [Rhodoblastus sp. 17X3]|uniref:VOC family protein n=1 Tax=Rhodoblastus sp. 17X3 TaxID=3047026 RepID=UPI0024B6B9BA|nr:VOC family protein [Rhodoblastus sp. 17X3]MDI9848362.1 VOC family protein [Rhodoblastus sp. 17X3]
MQFTPYLMFPGNCAEAFAHYEKALGAKIVAMFPYAQAPAGTPIAPGAEKKVMHACLEKDGFRLMASDMAQDCGPDSGQTRNVTVHISVADVEEAKRIIATLAEGGQMFMPPGETFWSRYYAMFADRFGGSWMVDCPRAPEELAANLAKA